MNAFATTLEEITAEGYNAYNRGDASNAPALNPLVMKNISDMKPEVGDPRVKEIMSAYQNGWNKGADDATGQFGVHPDHEEALKQLSY